jgi:primary-amine oxidase
MRLLLVILLFSGAFTVHGADHPMDPLSADEIDAAVSVVKASGKLEGAARFPIVRLVEMSKADVLAWEPGDAITRRAEVQAVTPAGFYTARVDLDAESLLSFDAITDGQPLLVIADAFMAMNLVRTNDEWKAALAARGIDNPNDVTPLPFFRGYWGNEDEKSRNIYRVYGFLSNDQENYWGRPIGGLSAEVDIQNREVLRVVDTGAVPIPDGNSEFHDGSNETMRSLMNPVTCAQSGGANYTIDGNVVRWGKWEFHLRFEQQEGLVLSNVTFDGRSVLYQASVSELFVPYMDPGEHWYFRNFMDAGEGGLGISASPLMRGVDCPDNATLLSPVLANPSGKGQEYTDAVAVYERYCGDPAWRHMDPVSRKAYGNRAQTLVVRNVSTVGNYDYAFDWCFDATGGIKVRVGATGIVSAKPVKSVSAAEDASGEDGAYGRFVDRYTVAINHDHYIAYRLDFDVDGVANSLAKDRLTPVRFENDTPRTSGWVIDSTIAQTENDAKLIVTPSKPTLWRIISSEKQNRNGYATSYHIKPSTTNFVSMLDDDDWPQKRAAFSKYNLYVTPYNPDERYAGGRTPNQNTGVDGLAVWSEANRPIEQTDIVAWYTLGFHHVVRAEDWPVMPTAWHEFYLRPFDFADTNPMMDVVERE